jgi:Ca-activated chloride channel homolog
MKFAYPQILYVLPLVWAVVAWAMYRSEKRRQLLLQKFAGAQFKPSLQKNLRRRLDRTLFFILITALYVTLARPMYFAKDSRNELRGASYLIALDASRSMLANDVPPTRYNAAGIALDRFFAETKGDHIGLITFAGVAYMNAPLTFDMTALRTILNYIDPQTLTDPGSNISSALDRAGRFFRSNSIPERTLIIISDGEDLDGNAVSLARKLFREEHLTIHTIGVGAATGGYIPAVRGDTYQTNSTGRQVVTKLDETNLRRIANAAGGNYYRLGHDGEGLRKLRAEVLNPLAEKIARNDLQNYHEAFYIPLTIAILALVTRLIQAPIFSAKGALQPQPRPKQSAGLG